MATVTSSSEMASEDYTCQDCGKYCGSQEELYAHSDQEHPAICPVCKEKAVDDTIACDQCDKWHHLVCVGLSRAEIPAEDEEWFCPGCRPKNRRPVAPAVKSSPVVAAPPRSANRPGSAPKAPVSSVSPASNEVLAAASSSNKQRTSTKKNDSTCTSTPFAHSTCIRSHRDGIKTNLRAVQTGSLMCTICAGHRAGPYASMKDSEIHYDKFHWARRLEFLASNGEEVVANVPCYLGCLGGAGEMHFHCPSCKQKCRNAEEHVVHAVSKHEYSLLHAEDFNRLIEVSQAVTERMHAQEQLRTLEDAEEGADDVELDDAVTAIDDAHIAALIEKLGEKYHCKLCPTSSTQPSFDAAKHHLKNLHMSNKYLVAGRYVCLPCFQECGPPNHFHCPICALTFLDQGKLDAHAETHEECRAAFEEVRAARAALADGEKSKAKSVTAKTANGGHVRSAKAKRAAPPRTAAPPKQPKTPPTQPQTEPKIEGAAPPVTIRGLAVAGLYVNFDRTETSIVVDKLHDADPASLEKYYEQLVSLEDGKYVCKLCPPPDDPSAAVLQPHDTVESARDHFLKCHFRFRVAITVVGNCLRCLRPCDNVPDSDGSGHYHCPYCPSVFTSQEAFIPHAADHLREQKRKEEEAKGVKRIQRLPLKWNVPPTDSKMKRAMGPAIPPAATVKPVERNSERPAARGRLSSIPTASRPHPRGCENPSARLTGRASISGSAKPIAGIVPRSIGKSTIRPAGRRSAVNAAVSAQAPAQSDVAAPLPAPTPTAPTTLETVSEESGDQVVITKRGRVSKPKPMADSIYSKPARRTVTPQAPAPVEPKRSPRVAKAAVPASSPKLPVPVKPSFPPNVNYGAKTWFKYPQITSEDVEHSVLRTSPGVLACGLCVSSSFRIKATAIEHFHTIHGDYAVAVCDKWLAVPCGHACPDGDHEMHYHCPECSQVVKEQGKFKQHVLSHAKVEVMPASKAKPSRAQPCSIPVPQQPPPLVKSSELLQFVGGHFECKLCSWTSSGSHDNVQSHMGITHLRHRVLVDKTKVVFPCYNSCSPALVRSACHFHCAFCDCLVTSAKSAAASASATSSIVAGCFVSHLVHAHGKKKDEVQLYPGDRSCRVLNDSNLPGVPKSGAFEVSVMKSGEEKRKPQALFKVYEAKPEDVALAPGPSGIPAHSLVNVKLEMIVPKEPLHLDLFLLGALSRFFENSARCSLCPTGAKISQPNIVEHWVDRHLRRTITVREPVRHASSYGPLSWCVECHCGRFGFDCGHFVCPVCQAVVGNADDFETHVAMHPGTKVGRRLLGSTAFGKGSTPAAREALLDVGFRINDPFAVSCDGTSAAEAVPSWVAFVEELKSLKFLLGDEGLGLCRKATCLGVDRQHFHCMLCDSPSEDKSELEGHVYACDGAGGDGKFVSNARQLLKMEQGRLVCKLCEESESVSWSVLEEREARSHAADHHLKPGIVFGSHVYPRCFLPCRMPNDKAGHVHCYGCDLVYSNPFALMSHFSQCSPTRGVVASRLDAIHRVKREASASAGKPASEDEVLGRKRRIGDEEVCRVKESDLEPLVKKPKTDEVFREDSEPKEEAGVVIADVTGLEDSAGERIEEEELKPTSIEEPMDTEEEDDAGMSETCVDAAETVMEEPMSVEVDRERATSMEVSDRDGNSDRSMNSPPELVVPAEMDESETELEHEQVMKSAAASPNVQVEATSAEDSPECEQEPEPVPVVASPDESTVVEETASSHSAVSEDGRREDSPNVEACAPSEESGGPRTEPVVTEVSEVPGQASSPEKPDVRSIFDETDDGDEAPAEGEAEWSAAAKPSTPPPSPDVSNADRDQDEAAAVLVSLGSGRFTAPAAAETPAARDGSQPDDAGSPAHADVFYTPAGVRSIPGAEFVTARHDFDEARGNDESVVLAEMAPVKLAFDGDEENVQRRN